ncbi:gephyrin-like molybdotransferase Glp [Arthrobacter sp. ISL-30]|uniref:molybdopterin molybdotransferase MoeA n=1 Tax=Arthrobacter sp. ISL-30 TaxID=2819109 RepID=UPI001BE8A450|nr:gephyrin-like molybdotransferase Glp [Arthrobacter sp. ISL-30]MBT2514260.1 molybdopterin molybdotransferase MoeA [Arthrobacter sp. ISL-30]
MARSVAAHRQAVEDLLSNLRGPSRTTMLPLLDALGLALAVDVVAPISLPPFDNSQMDGFAVRSKELSHGGGVLRVVAPVPAGAAPQPLEPGTAAPIMTGAMIPKGSDAVVPVERAVPAAFPPPQSRSSVMLPKTDAGDYVRRTGSDIAEGTVALEAGTALGPGQLGLLAALGLTEVEVYRPLRVLLLTTGDEVVPPGNPLGPGKIYDSNGTLLEAAMRQAGLEVRRLDISGDEPDVFLELVRGRMDSADLVVTTGGVSKGAYEVVRQAMDGQAIEFLSVAMQPGGPQGIGTFDGLPFLGFPGNPVSCLVSFEMFLRPALGALFGAPAPRPVVRARLAEALTSPAGKHQVRRATLRTDGIVQLEGGAGSHLMHALARSNAFVQVPEGVTDLPAGAEVEVWML